MPTPTPDLDQIIKETKDISPAPQILPKLKRLLDDPNSDLDEPVALIKMDVSLTGQVLKYANSSIFGIGVSVETLDHAIQRFGFRKVQKLVVTASAKTALGRDLSHFNTGGHTLFDVSLACAETMNALALSERFLDEDVAYTIGLFHGVGKIVVDTYFSKMGIVFYENDVKESATLEKEHLLLGFDHAKAGAALLKSWRFADSIISPIRDQFRHPESLGKYKEATLYLALSAVAGPHLMDKSFEAEHLVDEFIDSYPNIWEALPIDEDRVIDILDQARDSFQQNIQMTQGI